MSNVPLSVLDSFGTIKTMGVQAHTIRQISVINAPNLTGSDGDLVIDSGDTTRTDNGKLKVKGGLSGDVTKIPVLETGVWDSALSVGILTNTTTTAQTISDHVAAGTLLTGLKIPILGGNSMDPNKAYMLRNVGNSGHVAWGVTNDLGGNLSVGAAVVETTLSVGGEVTIEGNLNVQGTTTTTNSTTLTVEDKTIELGVVDSPTDATATGAGVIIKGATDKEILYTRSSGTSNSTQQLSAFQVSEDIVLGKKTKPFSNSILSQLTGSERSQVLHLGDIDSTDGHWMMVADITNGKLQFWYGHDIPDDAAMELIQSSKAQLAFEIQKPTPPPQPSPQPSSPVGGGVTIL